MKLSNPGFAQVDKESHKVWPQIITLLLALTTSLYTVWSQANPWFYLVPAILTLVAILLLARDSGLFTWLRLRLLNVSANRVAKSEYANFLKFVTKAKVYQELTRHLQNNIEWARQDSGSVEIPSFVNMNFDNWYNDILRSAEQQKISRALELVLIGDRFHDFLDILNSYYLRPYAEALRAGKGKYRNEQTLKELRKVKDAYDRFLEAYNEFSEELNGKARRRILIAIYSTPPAMDWSAAQHS